MSGSSKTNELGVAVTVCYLYGGVEQTLLGMDTLGSQCAHLLDVPQSDLDILKAEYYSKNCAIADACEFCKIYKQLTYKRSELKRSGESSYRSQRWILGAGA